MHARTYAEALYRATERVSDTERERLAGRLVDLVRQRGHARLFPRIVRELTHIAHTRATHATVTVRVAHRDDVVRREACIAADIATLAGTDMPRTITLDERVIGGYEVRCGSQRIDRTYKRTLHALYQTLVSST